MRRPPTSPPPIQLLPAVPRALSILAAGFSLSLHGALLAGAVAGTGHWITSQPAPITVRQATMGAVTYVAVLSPTLPPSRPIGRAGPRIDRSRPATPSESRDPLPRLPPPLGPAMLTLPAPTRQLGLRTSAIELVGVDKFGLTDRVGTQRKDDAPAPNDAPARDDAPARNEAPALNNVTRNGVTLSAGTGPRGTSRVAELLTNPGKACPEIRRPAHLDSEVSLEVAVKFVVDSLGVVDRTTLQVVKAPGTPQIATGFIPHIYAVGVTARVDRSLPEALPQYRAIVAGDLLRHVASLRFRPGSRNGRPIRSAVLVACGADRSGR
jgi:hypothetical protein